ncbi:MAG: DUF1343 domain-containing protein [Candidatus Wallbacteria bacterium]|nr:DUF1343 domain-containing protein [Candidatus Wallbacteria bacterium]
MFLLFAAASISMAGVPDGFIPGLMADMTLAEKIEQMILTSIPDNTPDDQREAVICSRIRDFNPGGVILFAVDLKEIDQVISLNNAIRKASKIPPFIALDQEGGRVTRLACATNMPGNMAIGATGSPTYAKESGRLIGTEIKALGFNLDFAPVMDVNNNAENPVICERSFGEDPQKVAEYGVEYMRGLHEAGIMSSAKHFPGHGDTSTDSHLDLPTIPHGWDRVSKVEFVPFKAIITQGVDFVMTAHVTFPALDPSTAVSKKTGDKINLPATLSDKILTGVLRKKLGFQGVIVTDALNMKAIADNFGTIEASLMAVRAGADILLMPSDPPAIVAAIASAVKSGKITEKRIDESVKRILSLKAEYGLFEAVSDPEAVVKARASVKCKTHLAVEKLIAVKAVTLVRNNGSLPLSADGRIGFISNDRKALDALKAAASLSFLKDGGQVTAYCLLDKDFPTADQKKEILSQDSIVLATYNLGRGANPEIAINSFNSLIDLLNEKGKKYAVLAIRSPYDSMYLPKAGTCLAIYGSEKTQANLTAGLEAIFGVFEPAGILPVTIPAKSTLKTSSIKVSAEKVAVNSDHTFPVRLGIDNLEGNLDIFQGKRIGLVTNQSGINSNFESSIDVLFKKVNLTALFAPEHGIRGCVQAGDTIGVEKDRRTGLQVFSLYGDTKKPTPEMLRNVDVLAYDMQDVGARFYTYINTMGLCMEACAELGKKFVVFDRPDPVSGFVGGNLLDLKYKSFVGMYPITQRYGMTIGEFAGYLNSEFKINCNLAVVQMSGWQRSMYYEDTGLKTWVMPSPNMPTIDTAVVYSGTCIFEGTNVSEGRGTTRPFELIGAPFIDGLDLADKLNGLNLPGVKFRAASFKPSFSKCKDEACQGVQVHVLNRRLFNPVKTGFAMIHTVKNMYPKDFQFLENDFINKIAGWDFLKNGKSLSDIFAMIDRQSEEFGTKVQQYLIYK